VLSLPISKAVEYLSCTGRLSCTWKVRSATFKLAEINPPVQLSDVFEDDCDYIIGIIKIKTNKMILTYH